MARLNIDAELAALADLPPAQLRERWAAVTGRPLHRVSPSLLRLALAWELQTQVHGGLSRHAGQKLDQLVAGKTATREAQPGMRLAREWKGKVHVVTIGDDKIIRWNKREWKSLSEAARAITGTRWSGPAFFGLKNQEGGGMSNIRCAIYTRKSSEEGWEQGFNSLDAQRETCAAYILSQASEGWHLLPGIYDDGRMSGGTLERPALQRLLADIAAGRIDIVVVYKVDRLTRSLLDFSKLVEAFDKAGVSFVSITQSFNTTTSMGRLTLNMLLSFAQFEREVTAERIRDKLAASKAKGMWMGGTPPLGYKPDGRSLAIVEDQARIIRDIYRDYLALGSVRLLAERLVGAGIVAPVRTTSTGKRYDGGRFSRGQLYAILKNPIYVGEIPHRGKIYPGLHDAIIDRETWDRVQRMLADHVQGSASRSRCQHKSLLAGIIFDSSGQPMLASHAAKGTNRYRYYVSRSLQRNEGKEGLRLPAREIEALVKEQAASLFDDPLALAARLDIDVSPALLRQLTATCEDLAHALRSRGGGPLPDIAMQVRALPEHLEIDLSAAKVAEMIGSPSPSEGHLTLRLAYKLTRTGRAMRLIQEDGSKASPGQVDPALVKLIVQARKWWGMLAGGGIDITALAEREGYNDSYITRIVRIAFLSPEVIEAIMQGRQHASLIAAHLRGGVQIPVVWDRQAAMSLPL